VQQFSQNKQTLQVLIFRAVESLYFLKTLHISQKCPKAAIPEPKPIPDRGFSRKPAGLCDG